MYRSLCSLARQALASISAPESASSSAFTHQSHHLTASWCRQAEIANRPRCRLFTTPAPSQTGPGALTIDKSAVQRLKQLQSENPNSSIFLRVEVEGGGCSGFNYKFNLDSDIKPGDIVFEKDGSRVVCDTVSLEFLKGAKIEFEESLMRSAFVVAANPNAEMTCGCGSSFAAKMI